MRSRTALLPASVFAFAAACSLTTSLDGLSTVGPAISEGGANVAESGGLDAAVASDARSTPEAGPTGYPTAVLADSPLAYFRFDDEGTTAKDETGAHHGTYKGVIAHGPGAMATESSMAAVFDGASYIDIGDVLPFTGNAPYTFEAWASPVAGATKPQCILAKAFAPGGVSGSVADGYSLYANSGSNFLNFVRFTAGNPTGPSGSALENQRFTHVVATYDGTLSTIFVDGVAVKAGASPTPITNVAPPLTLGAGRGGIYCYFHGALDEVAIYGTVLTPERVIAHYVAGSAK